VSNVRIESIQRSGANVVITVTAGARVQLQKKVKLDDPAWQNVGVPGSGPFTVPIGEATSFFRAEIR
jgi:hypothetical protein